MSANDFETVLQAIHAEGLCLHMLMEHDSAYALHGERWRASVVKQGQPAVGWKGSSKDSAPAAMFDALEGYRQGESQIHLPQGNESSSEGSGQTQPSETGHEASQESADSGQKGPGRPRKHEQRTTKVKGQNADKLRDELLAMADRGEIPSMEQVQRLPQRHKKVVENAIEEAKKHHPATEDADLSSIFGEPAAPDNTSGGETKAGDESLADILGAGEESSAGGGDAAVSEESEESEGLEDIL